MASNMQNITVVSRDGVRLVGDQGGDSGAPAVVLLHGGGQTRHSWSRAAQVLLAEGLQVISYDARGHGESDWSPDAAYQLADRSDDLAAVVSALRVPFVLVGASLGGATSIVAIDRGLRPAGPVLVDIVPEPDPRGIDRIVSFMRGHPEGFAAIGEAVEAVAAYNPRRRASLDGTGMMKNLRKGADGRLRWHWDPRILEHAPEHHHGAVRRAVRGLAALSSLPVLLVRGLSSDVVSDTGVEAFRNLLPRLETVDVADAGHMVAGDRNDAFNEAVAAFSRRVLSVDDGRCSEENT